LRRCNGTDKQKTDLSAFIENLKQEFRQQRCSAVLEGQQARRGRQSEPGACNMFGCRAGLDCVPGMTN
jgi:hypothetical protein